MEEQEQENCSTWNKNMKYEATKLRIKWCLFVSRKLFNKSAPESCCYKNKVFDSV